MKAEAVVRKALHRMHQTLGPIHYYGTRYDRAALAERVDIPSFRVDPLCDPLREDPRFAGRAQFQGQIDAAGNATGELTVLRGTGGLVNLHGKLTLNGQAGVGGTYEGRVNFAP